MARPLFQLGPRLALCAQLTREGRRVCDIGTDHAYLPIWLLKSGKTPAAIACDINPGPLAAAEQNARRYRVEDRLTLRLSDGLREVSPDEAEDVIAAGMGGELILRIVAETPWLRDPDKLLVLQPMSSAADLRRGLNEIGFQIVEELAVEDAGRPYTAFTVRFYGQPVEDDPLYPYVGRLRPGTPAAKAYAEKLLRDLTGRLEGALRGRGEDDPGALREAIEGIRERFGIEDFYIRKRN